MQNRFETFEKFDDNFFNDKIKEFNQKILNKFSDKKVEIRKFRFSQNISMSVSSCNFMVDIHEFKYLLEMKEISSITCYKSIDNNYLYISSESLDN
jgi:hypothetical protein